MKWGRRVSNVAQGPASLIGSRVSSVGFAYQTVLELFHQADDGTIRVHVDLVVFSPFVLRSSDGTVCNLDPATSRAALAPVIDLFGATITGVTVDGDDTVERDIAGNPVNTLGTLTLDFADGSGRKATAPPGRPTPATSPSEQTTGARHSSNNPQPMATSSPARRAFSVPTRSSSHLGSRSMTAQAGQPAKDPDDSGASGLLGPGDTASLGTSVSGGAVDADAVEADDFGPGQQAGDQQAGRRQSGSQAERSAALRARLITPMPDDQLWGWIGPLLVTLFGGFLRFSRLSFPHAITFDETYYAKDAWSILQHGVEWTDLSNANNLILSGHTSIFHACSGTACGEYVVQPPAGKLLIAVGEWFFGLTTLGWRFAPAVFGTLAILVMCRVVRRMTRSTLLGCAAGLLLSLDGLEFVLSRTGILDIFLMFFVLAAFGALVVDRDVSRAKLAEAVVLHPGDAAGPGIGIRKWRVAAGILIGLGCASKQYGVWYIIGFAALCIAWDMGARRTAGLRRYVTGALVRDGKWLLLTLGVIPLVTYTLTWAGWLVTNTGYDRDYAQRNGFNVPILGPLYSLLTYHKEMAQFGVGLNSRHPYMSQPWDWFMMSRPVAFYWVEYTDPAGLHVQTNPKVVGPYVREVLAIGNPVIWWVSIPAMLFCLGWWLTRRDWRAGSAVLCIAAGWVTWLPFVSRTKFYYYALEFEPFIIIAIVLCLGLIIGLATAGRHRRAAGSALAGVYVLTALIVFWYFHPILTGQVITYQDWLSHMWYRGLFGPALGWI